MTGHWAGSTRRSHLPPNWATEIRPRILDRDGHQCTWLDDGMPCGEPATDVDHVVPHHLGGTDEDHNLTSLCGPHHARKSATEGNAARNKLRAQLKRPREAHPGLL